MLWKTLHNKQKTHILKEDHKQLYNYECKYPKNKHYTLNWKKL